MSVPLIKYLYCCQAAAAALESKPSMVRNAVYEEAPGMFDDDDDIRDAQGSALAVLVICI